MKKIVTYSLYKPSKFISKKTSFNHKVYLDKKGQEHIVPIGFESGSISPKNFLGLKRKLKFQKVLIFDKLKTHKTNLCIINHVNRAGYNFLIGKTPLENREMFPDMSFIYNNLKGWEKCVVHTVGPDRFLAATDPMEVLSEAAGLVAPVWHYVGVNVYAIGNAQNKLKQIFSNLST